MSLFRLAAFVAIQLPQAFDGRHPPDFPNYYVAGLRLLEERPVYVSLESEVLARLGWSYSFAAPADTPFTVVLLSPLALLPYRVAWIVLFAASVLVIPWTTWLVAREAGWSRPFAITAAALGCVTVHARYLLAFNHVESLVLLSMVLGWRALRHSQHARAGAWWGAAIALKLFPALLLVPLAASRRWRVLAVATMTATALLVVGGIAVGGDDVRRFISDVLPQSDHFMGRLGNFSLLSVGTGIGGPLVGRLVEGVGIACVVSLLARRPGGPDRLWVTATAGALLVSPLSWIGYPVLVWPCLVVFLAALRFTQMTEVLAGIGLVVTLGFWPDSFYISDPRLNLVVSSAPTVALGALAAMASRRLS